MQLLIKEVVNPYGTNESKNRKGLMVQGEWDNGIIDYINANNIKALYLNYAHGWSGIDYLFLEKLSSIEELQILSGEAKSLESIEKMTNLVELSISCITNSKVDFSVLDKLNKLYVKWWKGVMNLSDSSSIENLYLDKAKFNEYSDLGDLVNLRNLVVANSDIVDLGFLRKLSRLRELSLVNCRKVTDFSEIGKIKDLVRLTVRGCNHLNNLDFVKTLTKLEVLIASDTHSIKSLSPLVNLKRLKAFSFAGSKTTITDGDLTVLTTLENLAMLMFGPRRHYTHKLIKDWDWNNFDFPCMLLRLKKVKKK